MSRRYVVTLTYFRRDLVRQDQVLKFCRSLRGFSTRRHLRLKFTWTAETTKAGALHYHFVVSFPLGGDVQSFVSHVQRSWRHGFVQVRSEPGRDVVVV